MPMNPMTDILQDFQISNESIWDLVNMLDGCDHETPNPLEWDYDS